MLTNRQPLLSYQRDDRGRVTTRTAAATAAATSWAAWTRAELVGLLRICTRVHVHACAYVGMDEYAYLVGDAKQGAHRVRVRVRVRVGLGLQSSIGRGDAGAGRALLRVSDTQNVCVCVCMRVRPSRGWR